MPEEIINVLFLIKALSTAFKDFFSSQNFQHAINAPTISTRKTEYQLCFARRLNIA
jgi:hypothetical protein